MASEIGWPTVRADKTPTYSARLYGRHAVCRVREAPCGATVYAEPGNWWTVAYPDGTQERGCGYGGGIRDWVSGLSRRGAEVLRSVLGGRVERQPDGAWLLVRGLGVEGGDGPAVAADRWDRNGGVSQGGKPPAPPHGGKDESSK